MKEIFQEAMDLLKAGTAFAVVTVIRTWGSAPRKAGAHMLVSKGKMVGSVSGGCIENDVYENAVHVIDSRTCALLRYGVSDEDAWQAGLSCGGNVDLFVEMFSPEAQGDLDFWNMISNAIAQDTGAVIVRKLSVGAPERRVHLPGQMGDSGLARAAAEAFHNRAHQIKDVEGKQYFIEVVSPRHHVLIFGAAHIGVELVSLAKQFDFMVSVIDPRGFYTGATAFPVQPDKIYTAWPAEVLEDNSLTPYTYAVTLSHDPRIDDQALERLLRSDVGYIGALGSRKTHEKRLERLRARGFSDNLLNRIHAPVGVAIHAQSAREIALSIIAQLVSEKNKYVL